MNFAPTGRLQSTVSQRRRASHFHFDNWGKKVLPGRRTRAEASPLIGTQGIIDIRVDNTSLAHLLPASPSQPVKEPRSWIPITAAGVGEPEPNTKIGNLVMSHEQGARDLIAAIQENRQPLCSAANGRLTVEMITAVMLSHVNQGGRTPFPLNAPTNPFAGWS